MSRPLAAALKDLKQANHDLTIAEKVLDSVHGRLDKACAEVGEILALKVNVRKGSILRSSGPHRGDWCVQRIDASISDPGFSSVCFRCRAMKKDGSVGVHRAAFFGSDFPKYLSVVGRLADKGGEEHGSAEGRQNAAS